MNSSITKRWIRGSLAATIAVLIIAEIIFVVFLHSSYYSAAEDAILSRINSINATLNSSAGQSDGEKIRLLYSISEDFAEKDKFEFTVIDPTGRIAATSTGFMPRDDMHMEDIVSSANSYDGISTNRYRTRLGEKVLTATCITERGDRGSYAVRLVTSLENVDAEINAFVALSLMVAGAIILFSVMSGMYFVRSIVSPLKAIEEGAEKISKGEFDVRIENEYNDEVGRLRSAVNNMARELGRTDEIKNEFISSVSHELRTPLTAIKGWAETISNDRSPRTVERGVSVILGETDRLYSMVENLLDFSRLQQSDMKMTKERMDLMAEVGEAAIMFEPRCKKRGIELIWDETEDVIPVWGDKDRLRQVMVNLLDNAIKYTPSGGRIEISVRRDRIRGLVTVSVLDNGQGISPEDIDKVTQKFYKGREAKRGSGIGLALVKEIIEGHDGVFRVESEYGHWTKMSFTLKTIRAFRRKNE